MFDYTQEVVNTLLEGLKFKEEDKEVGGTLTLACRSNGVPVRPHL